MSSPLLFVLLFVRFKSWCESKSTSAKETSLSILSDWLWLNWSRGFNFSMFTFIFVATLKYSVALFTPWLSVSACSVHVDLWLSSFPLWSCHSSWLVTALPYCLVCDGNIIYVANTDWSQHTALMGDNGLLTSRTNKCLPNVLSQKYTVNMCLRSVTDPGHF